MNLLDAFREVRTWALGFAAMLLLDDVMDLVYHPNAWRWTAVAIDVVLIALFAADLYASRDLAREPELEPEAETEG